MLKNILLITTFLLAGCGHNEYKGHYKIDENKLQNGITKSQIINLFGTPITFAGMKDVFYYAYTKTRKSPIGIDKEKEAKIIRLEFKDNLLVKSEFLDYSNFVANKEITKQPEMKLNIMFEIVEVIGKVTGMEEGQKQIDETKSK